VLEEVPAERDRNERAADAAGADHEDSHADRVPDGAAACPFRSTRRNRAA
jgi:hypothetical protein